MGKYCDFIVNYDSNQINLGRNILRNMMVNRIKCKKPCIIFIQGDSGEGKSYTGLALEKIVYDEYNINMLDMLDAGIIYTPLEYTTKMKDVLFWRKQNKPEYKDVHVIMIDEAREVIGAKKWYEFINQAIVSCNAMSRAEKPMVFIIISQFIKDIDSDARYTINYYGKCFRPMGKSTTLDMYTLWKDDYDVNKPKLRKRPVRGITIDNGVRSVFLPKFFVKFPDKEIVKGYEVRMKEAKETIIMHKFDRMDEEMESYKRKNL